MSNSATPDMTSPNGFEYGISGVLRHVEEANDRTRDIAARSGEPLSWDGVATEEDLSEVLLSEQRSVRRSFSPKMGQQSPAPSFDLRYGSHQQQPQRQPSSQARLSALKGDGIDRRASPGVQRSPLAEFAAELELPVAAEAQLVDEVRAMLAERVRRIDSGLSGMDTPTLKAQVIRQHGREVVRDSPQSRRR